MRFPISSAVDPTLLLPRAANQQKVFVLYQVPYCLFLCLTLCLFLLCQSTPLFAQSNPQVRPCPEFELQDEPSVLLTTGRISNVQSVDLFHDGHKDLIYNVSFGNNSDSHAVVLADGNEGLDFSEVILEIADRPIVYSAWDSRDQLTPYHG